jgi:uncharacterized SAM-binding protein YcdF (DUF218 family)
MNIQSSSKSQGQEGGLAPAFSLTLSKVLKSKTQIAWRLIVCAVALLALLPTLAWGAARLLIVRTPVAHAEAIVMLSGSATFRERATHVAELYKQGRASRVILTNDNLRSGWSEVEQRNPFYYERAVAELRQAGVSPEHIDVSMDPILGTYDEACVVRLYCERHQVHSIIVVTSGYHSRRALWTFQHVFRGSGIEVSMDPVAAGIDTPPPATWWLKSFGWQMVPQEYAKLGCYWLGFR